MNKESCKKSHLAFIGSVALNIFLLAFVLGRMSMAPPPPPPPPFGEHGPRGMHGGGPFFSPSGLFTPEEMKAEMAKGKENFDKMRDLRKAFAAKLKQGPVTRDEVAAHFAEMDKMMDTMRKSTQKRVADKITSMSDEDRTRFADKLLEDKPGPRFGEDRGPHSDAPPPPPPGGPGDGAPPAPPPGGEPPPPPED